MAHSIQVRVAALVALLAIEAWAGAAHAVNPITLSVQSPMANAVETDTISLSATATSTNGAIQSVTAQSGTFTTNLMGGSSTAPWTGTLSIAGLPSGPQTVTIKATDALGYWSTLSIPFVHDGPPVIFITAPIWSVAHPMARIAATCTTANPSGCSMQATVGSVTLTGQNSIDQSADLSANNGKELTVTFSATDSLNQTASATSQVYVDTSPRLVEVAYVPGMILDFDQTRILYFKPSGDIAIHWRPSGPDNVVGKSMLGGSPAIVGSLTSTGATWTSNEASAQCSTTAVVQYVWTGTGAAAVIGQSCMGYPLTIAGDWAMQYGQAVLNLTSKASRTFPPASMASTLSAATVAPTGDAFGFFAQSDMMHADIYQDHAGALTKLGTVQAVAGYPMSPVTDGTGLVFNAVVANVGNSIELFTGGMALPIGQPGSRSFAAPVDYQINNGWVAFRQASAGIYQVWYRSPLGDSKQLSIFNSDSAVDAIGPTGEIMFLNGASRYLRLLPGLPDMINTTLGTAVAKCDGWYVRIGGSLFKVSNTQDAGTGSCPPVDGGAPPATQPDAQAGTPADSGMPAQGDSGDASTGPSNPMTEGGVAQNQNDASAAAQDASGMAQDGGALGQNDDGGSTLGMLDATLGDDGGGGISSGGGSNSISSSPSGCGCRVVDLEGSTGQPWTLGASAIAIALATLRRRASRSASARGGQVH